MRGIVPRRAFLHRVTFAGSRAKGIPCRWPGVAALRVRLLWASALALLALVPAALAQRADALGIDGIYAGTMGMQIAAPSGKNLNYQAPAKLVFLPDGKAAILTAQHPDGVVSLALKGSLSGNTFVARSKGLMDYGGYHYGMVWDIVFDAKKGTAVLHGKTLNLPKWAKEDDDHYTFRKKK